MSVLLLDIFHKDNQMCCLDKTLVFSILEPCTNVKTIGSFGGSYIQTSGKDYKALYINGQPVFESEAQYGAVFFLLYIYLGY